VKRTVAGLVVVFLLLQFIPILHPVIKSESTSTTVFYDFVSNAGSASWSSGAGTLPFPGSDSDPRGFALYRTQAVLEDNKTYAKVLETHPQWVDLGWIQGIYPQLTVPTNAKLNVTVGFLKGATNTDGVIFRVYFRQGQTQQTLLEQKALYDNKLDTISIDLSSIAGKMGNFILYVNAFKGSGQDWAVWASATIEQTVVTLPDLTITDIRRSGSTIYYTIKNIGDASVGSLNQIITYSTALFVDGSLKALDQLNLILQPGQSVERSFNYQYSISGTEDTVKVCADYNQNVTEKDESNNCKEVKWTQELPDLTVSKIYCSGDNRVTFTLANVGSAPLPSGSDGYIDIYVNGTKVTWIKLSAVPTSSTGGGIYNAGGTSTYMMSTQITTTSAVKVVVDSTNTISESNETSNTLEVQLEPCAKLQDIAISLLKCNYEKKVIEFILKNIGGLKIDKPFDVALYVNGVLKETKRVTSSIEPGNTYSSNFSYVLTCTNIKVKIFADSGNEILESDETNNIKEIDCKCQPTDTTPPKITKGPEVSKITQTSAVITWETDEESDSKVYYGAKFKKLDQPKGEEKLTKVHSITLSGLQPLTVYVFMVESKDGAGNSVQSKEKVFETLPEEDKDKPTVSLVLPEKLSGIAKIRANVNDNKGIDRVVFSMDGKVMFTDFSYPYEWNLDTTKIPDESHSFKASVFDFAGNIAEDLKPGISRNSLPPEFSPIRVTIFEPASRSSVYGYVQIQATISSDIETCISRAELWVDETLVETYDFHCLPRPVWMPGGSYYSGSSTQTINYNWNTVGIAKKSYEIEVKAWDERGNYGHHSIAVSKVEEPTTSGVPLSITRSVRRPTYFQYFTVELSITNNGPNSDYNIINLTVVDKCKGFQPVNREGLLISRDSEGNNVVTKNLGRLPYGSTVTLSYDVIPILYDPPLSVYEYTNNYIIGLNSLSISYDDVYGRHHSRNYPSPTFASSTEVQNAFRQADYLIVTNPSNLYSTYDEREVNTLLSTAAELAREKLGVLAYLQRGSSAEHFKNLISATGSGTRWFEFLQDGWVCNGYMLIIGEDNIVPSWAPPTDMWREYTNGDINCSDYYYADTASGDNLPDIKVGRIIGGDVQTMIKPIRASIDVSKHVPGHNFNGSNALLISGPEDTWECFVDEVNSVGRILQSQGVTFEKVHREYFITEVRLLREALVIRGDYQCTGEPGHLDERGAVCIKTHPPTNLESLLRLISIEEAINVQEHRRQRPTGGTYDYHFVNDTEAWDAGTLAIKLKMPGKSIFFWSGHGGWGPMMEFVGGSFGDSHPVIFADSCLTGKYDRVVGNPEYAFGVGAAVYIGATELSPADGSEFAEKFFRDYWFPGVICGDALTTYKRWMWQTGDYLLQYRALEYNLYGDPKYGRR